MEQIDPKMAERVWQRVQQREEPADLAYELPLLLAQAVSVAAILRGLSRKHNTEQLKTLHREALSQAECLKGICRLLTGELPEIAAPPLPRDTAGPDLRRCYGQMLRCLSRYTHWSSHPEYGPVFSHLAGQESRQLQRLARLLGRMG